MGRKAAEEVGPQHPVHHRSEPARRLPDDAAVLPRRRGAEALVDERDHLVLKYVP